MAQWATEANRSGEKVLATVVKLLESTLVRVGNEECARSNGSFGLTTLRDRHVRFRGTQLTFEFRAKGGVRRRVCVHDPALTRIVRRCADIPGQELFQWIDAAGRRHRIDSSDVNQYLREATGGPFTAKDFRTWSATLEAVWRLRKCGGGRAGVIRKEIKNAIDAISARLGNTPTICRNSYIHPEVLAAYADGRLAKLNGCSPVRALRDILRRCR
jgi:DNA topoisomerase-1